VASNNPSVPGELAVAAADKTDNGRDRSRKSTAPGIAAAAMAAAVAATAAAIAADAGNLFRRFFFPTLRRKARQLFLP
jgi:hypothetical protein